MKRTSSDASCTKMSTSLEHGNLSPTKHPEKTHQTQKKNQERKSRCGAFCRRTTRQSLQRSPTTSRRKEKRKEEEAELNKATQELEAWITSMPCFDDLPSYDGTLSASARIGGSYPCEGESRARTWRGLGTLDRAPRAGGGHDPYMTHGDDPYRTNTSTTTTSTAILRVQICLVSVLGASFVRGTLQDEYASRVLPGV